MTLKNLTRESAGVYKCTASNDVGEDNCTLEVKVHCKYLCEWMHSEWHASEAYYENLLFSKNSAQFEVINASNRSMLHCWHITSFRFIFNLACAIQFSITSEINMQIEKNFL